VRSLIALFRSFLVIFAAFILLGLLIAASPKWGLYSAAALGFYSFLACFRPYKPSWLGGVLTSIALLFVAAIAAPSLWSIRVFNVNKLTSRTSYDCKR